MSFLPKSERHDCEVCGIWVCLDCGWTRRPANLARPDLQYCPHCNDKNGEFRPVQHAAPYMQLWHDQDAERMKEEAR